MFCFWIPWTNVTNGCTRWLDDEPVSWSKFEAGEAYHSFRGNSVVSCHLWKLFQKHGWFHRLLPIDNELERKTTLVANRTGVKPTLKPFNLQKKDTTIQEISNRTHWTDPEKTWVSNSSIATYFGVRWDSVPIQFLMETTPNKKNKDASPEHGFFQTEILKLVQPLVSQTGSGGW